MPTADLRFCAPTRLADALGELAGREDAMALGGGTSLALLLKNGLIEPRVLVWLGRVAGLADLTASPGGGLNIGATVTMRDLARSGAVRRYAGVLADAAGRVGNPRVRSVATVGGALAHGDPRQDLPPVLLALGAAARVAGPAGEREIPLAAFHTGFLETALGPGELLTGVVVPPGGGRSAVYERFTPGSEDDYPTVAVAACVSRDAGGRITGVTLAVGGAGPVPFLVPEAGHLTGAVTPGAGAVGAVAAAAAAAARPATDQRGSARYKTAMVGEWARRALRSALAGGGRP